MTLIRIVRGLLALTWSQMVVMAVPATAATFERLPEVVARGMDLELAGLCVWWGAIGGLFTVLVRLFRPEPVAAPVSRLAADVLLGAIAAGVGFAALSLLSGLLVTFWKVRLLDEIYTSLALILGLSPGRAMLTGSRLWTRAEDVAMLGMGKFVGATKPAPLDATIEVTEEQRP